MARLDFCGGSYSLETINADNQRSVNLYPEIVESGAGRSKMTLMPTPGIKSIAGLDSAPRGQLEFNGRLFVVGGVNFYEITMTTPGTFGFPSVPIVVGATIRNPSIPLANDGLPASLAANENQILIASGGSVYIYYVNTMNDSVTGQSVVAGTFKQVPATNFTLSTGNAPVKQVAFCDSFFLALIANSQNVQVSNVLDGFNWIPGGSIVGGVYTGGVSTQVVVSVTPENVVGIIVDHRQLWMFGRKKIVGYVSGDPVNIFGVQFGAFIEQGAAATFAISQLDNSIFWISGDDKGDRMAFRLNGLTPQRISTHAVEFAWKAYPKSSDAVSYSYQDGGHSFWVVLFPSANKGNGATWVYDVASGLWHERDLLNQTSGVLMGHPSWNHSFWNGVHIVGDWRSTNLYQMDIGFFDNAGVPITRLRRAAHISTELEMIRYDRFTLDAETGLGPVLQGTSVPSTITLKDANNQLWNLTVLDNGTLQTVAVGSGTPQTLILNDAANAHTWQVGITITGTPTTTALALSTNPTTVAMNSSGFFWNVQVTAAGLLQTVGTGINIRSATVFLRWSDDAGHTWSDQQPRSLGLLGQYRIRAIWYRLGASRMRTFEVSCSEPIPLRIVDGYINAAPGYAPSERLAKQMSKVA